MNNLRVCSKCNFGNVIYDNYVVCTRNKLYCKMQMNDFCGYWHYKVLEEGLV